EAQGAFWPQIDFGGGASRQQSSGGRNLTGHRTLNNVFTLGPTVSYSPDVFGGTRRQVEQAGALATGQACQVAAAYLTLTGNVVSQALGVAGTRLEIGAAQEIIADDEHTGGLVQEEYHAGKAPRGDPL